MFTSAKGWFVMPVILFCVLCGCALSHIGCAAASEEGGSIAVSVSPGETAPRGNPLEIWPPRHDEPRMIHGREDTCLSTYEIVNPNDEARGVTTLVISAQPAFTFETIDAEWSDDTSTPPHATMPDENGQVVIMYPDAGVQIAPRSSRTVRLCGVAKKVVGAGQGNGVSPESGSVITATLLVVEELDGRHARFMDKDNRPHHVLRASEPHISLEPVTSNELRPGTSTLLEWNLVAHGSGPIALKQFGFNLNLTDVTLCSFRLLDDSDEGPSEYEIAEMTGDVSGARNVREGCLNQPTKIVATFNDEYRFGPGSGAVFTLQADITAVGERPSLKVNLLRSTDVLTDTLACDIRGFALFSSNMTILPGLIWSDLSAVPHSSVTCSTSRDWITDALVLDF